MFRFVRDRERGGDPSKRRYTAMRAEAEKVGVVRMEGLSDKLTRLAVECDSAMTDLERDALLSALRLFMEELAIGWGQQAEEVVEAGSGSWFEHPEGGVQCGLVFRIA